MSHKCWKKTCEMAGGYSRVYGIFLQGIWIFFSKYILIRSWLNLRIQDPYKGRPTVVHFHIVQQVVIFL